MIGRAPDSYRVTTLWVIVVCLQIFVVENAFSSQTLPKASPVSDTWQARLTNDVRLNKTISLDEIGVSFDELLKKLSGKDLILRADRTCNNQKLHIRLKQRSLRTLMMALAELLPGLWEPMEEQEGYLLTMKPSAVRRRSEWWRIYLGERERALSEARSQVLQTMRKAPYRRRPSDINPEQSDPVLEAEIADKQDFMRALPPTLQEQVANQMLDFRYYNLQGDIPMGYYEEAATVIPLGALPPQIRKIVQTIPSVSRFASKRSINWEKVALRFVNSGYAVSVSIAQPNGDATNTHELVVGNTPKSVVLWLNHIPLVETVREMGKKAPILWKQLDSYQKSQVWQNALPTKIADKAPPRRVDALKRLAQQGDIEFVSDYYSLPGWPLPSQVSSAPLKHSLSEELALFAVEQDTSWKYHEDNLYLFRANRWYRNDYLEVPAALLRAWYAPDKGNAPITRRMNFTSTPSLEEIRQRMDWMSEVVTSLNLWQICNGLLYFAQEVSTTTAQKKDDKTPSPPIYDLRDTFPFYDDVNHILHQYRTLLFYASLTPPQRTALVENRLPFASLTIVQQQQAAAFLSVTNPTLQASLTPRTSLGLISNVGKEVIGFHNLPRLRLRVVEQ